MLEKVDGMEITVLCQKCHRYYWERFDTWVGKAKTGELTLCIKCDLLALHRPHYTVTDTKTPGAKQQVKKGRPSNTYPNFSKIGDKNEKPPF